MDDEQQAVDDMWMQKAIDLARHAERLGEVPVGAVLVQGDECVGEGWNQPITGCDPTAHAEIVALRRACSGAGNYRIPGAVLYVTLEPCPMCAGALVHARVQRVVFGAADPRAGAGGSVFSILDSDRLNHRVMITKAVREDECGYLLQSFFKHRRGNKT